MVEEITSFDLIGGPGNIVKVNVEVDEPKFGKLKYNRRRLVEGN